MTPFRVHVPAPQRITVFPVTLAVSKVACIALPAGVSISKAHQPMVAHAGREFHVPLIITWDAFQFVRLATRISRTDPD